MSLKKFSSKGWTNLQLFRLIFLKYYKLYNVFTEQTCRDRKAGNYCKRYKGRCFDPKRQGTMVKLCKKSCGLCDIDCNQEGHMIQNIDSQLQCVGKYMYLCIYVTGNLCNPALRVMTEHFRHYAKCLNSSGISWNA